MTGPTDPWDRHDLNWPWRLGMVLHGDPRKTGGGREAGIGWAAIKLRANIGEAGQSLFDGSIADAADRVEAALRAQIAAHEGTAPEAIELFRYANGPAFAGSRAQLEGHTREEHSKRTLQLADELRRRGHVVEIQVVKA